MSKIIVFLICISLIGCLSYKELPVEYDYSYSGRFKNYRTYDMIKYAGDRQDTLNHGQMVEWAIAQRMKSQGYKQTDRKPDLLIGYTIFYDSLNFPGYIQPDIEIWANNWSQVDEEYLPKNYNIRKGTILIQLFDRKKQKTIWQGYATSNFEGLSFTDQVNIRNAVLSILDKYKFLADGFAGNLNQEQVDL